MKAQERPYQRGVGLLHVLRAAAVIVAVLLNKLEGIGVPVGGQGLDNIDVAEKQHRLFRRGRGGADADHEVLFLRVRAEQVNVIRREACIEKTLLHGFGRGGHTAFGCVGGVDFDELFENVAGVCAICRRSSGVRRLGRDGGRRKDDCEYGGEPLAGHGCNCTAMIWP